MHFAWVVAGGAVGGGGLVPLLCFRFAAAPGRAVVMGRNDRL
jgi:hypothetical protein